MVILWQDCYGKGNLSVTYDEKQKVVDVIARLPDCDGQAADVVSAYTQVKMEDASERQRQNVRTSGYVFHDTNGHNHGKTSMSQWSLLKETCTDIHLQGSCGEDSSKKFCWNTVGKKVPNWECLLANREEGLFLSVYVDDIKLAGEETKHRPNVASSHWSTKGQKKVHFATLMDISHRNNAELEQKFQKIKAESCSEVTL